MEYPQLLQIETTAYCNAKCIFCSHKSMKREKGQMTWETFIKVIAQCKEANIKRICPFLNGEPFLDTLFFKRLRYINKELPDVKLDIFTNISLLDEDKLKKLSRVKNIDTFFVSVTSYDYESCKGYMGLDFDQIRKNVSALIKLNKEKKFINRIQAASIDMGLEENKKFITFWHNFGFDRYFISAKENWLGEIGNNKQGNQNIICPRAFHMCVYFDGTVPLCCFDNDALRTFGNIHERTLLEIYNSEEYKKYRTVEKSQLFPCNKCSV